MEFNKILQRNDKRLTKGRRHTFIIKSSRSLLFLNLFILFTSYLLSNDTVIRRKSFLRKAVNGVNSASSKTGFNLIIKKLFSIKGFIRETTDFNQNCFQDLWSVFRFRTSSDVCLKRQFVIGEKPTQQCISVYSCLAQCILRYCAKTTVLISSYISSSK